VKIYVLINLRVAEAISVLWAWWIDQLSSLQSRLGAGKTRQLRNIWLGLHCSWPFLRGRRIHQANADSNRLYQDRFAFGFRLCQFVLYTSLRPQ
jgi:hypothetical protein